MAKETQTVLLQTARAVAYDETGSNVVPVRILLDNGSQRSYITEQLSAKLNLKSISHEKLILNTFGDDRYKTQESELMKL